MHISSVSDITQFLRNFKKIAQKKFCFIPRGKNLHALAEFGITIKQAKNIVFQLTYQDYCSGPKKDRDRKSNNVWEFGTKLNEEGIYIKLSDDLGSNVAKCISFHKAEFKVYYPHKK